MDTMIGIKCRRGWCCADCQRTGNGKVAQRRAVKRAERATWRAEVER